MGYIDILKTELALPAYDGTTDQQATDILNDEAIGDTLPVDTMRAAELFELIDTAEYTATTSDQKATIGVILGLSGDLDITPTSKVRETMMGIFLQGSATRTAIGNAVSQAVSRGVFLGIGIVKVGWVQEARR